MLSKIIDPCNQRTPKLTTCCIIVRILGGFCDARLKCSIVWRSFSLTHSSHFRQMWLQMTTRLFIGAHITCLLLDKCVAWCLQTMIDYYRSITQSLLQSLCCTKWDRYLPWAIITFQDSRTRRDYCVPAVLNHLADEDYWSITSRHCTSVLVTISYKYRDLEIAAVRDLGGVLV